MRDVFATNAISLIALTMDIGEEKTLAFIALWIVDIIDFLNIKNTMGEDQIDQTTELILSEYPYCNIADINLIFRRIKIGHYGELYNRFDGQIILKIFDKYFNERTRLASDDSLAAHYSTKETGALRNCTKKKREQNAHLIKHIIENQKLKNK